MALLVPSLAWATGESLCAVVKIEIIQQLTLERQAFDARMKINNGLENAALQDVAVQVNFEDATGAVVSATSDPNNTNALFFIRLDRMDGIADVAGNGTVAQSTSAEIHWQIIPAQGAGGQSSAGVRYLVGATLRYKLSGESHVMEVVPDDIYVKPMPKLILDYFLPRDVYGDDAFTGPIEPSVPFSLGVRVSNGGQGSARGLKIDSGQPKIVENILGLLIGFNITGSEVNGLPATDSLLVDFGNIGPSEAGTARWIMECSLSGRFTEFTAGFSHADELGGRLTSLIDPDGIRTHVLVHDVLVDLPGRDSIRDFLALNGATYGLFESSGVDALVPDASLQTSVETSDNPGSGQTMVLDTPDSAGLFYTRQAVAQSDFVEIVSAIRSDGKRLNLANVWFSKTRDSGGAPWRHYINLFDVNVGGRYVIAIRDESESHRPVIGHVGNKAILVNDPLGLGFLVEASDPDGTVPYLSASEIPPGAEFVVSTNGGLVTGTFFWRPVSGQEGVYRAAFTAADGVLESSKGSKMFVLESKPLLDLVPDVFGRPGIDLYGLIGETYFVEYATNLLSGAWTQSDVVTISEETLVVPVEMPAGNHRLLFFRVRGE